MHMQEWLEFVSARDGQLQRLRNRDFFFLSFFFYFGGVDGVIRNIGEVGAFDQRN